MPLCFFQAFSLVTIRKVLATYLPTYPTAHEHFVQPYYLIGGGYVLQPSNFYSDSALNIYPLKSLAHSQSGKYHAIGKRQAWLNMAGLSHPLSLVLLSTNPI